MAYQQKVWQNRLSEYPTRRLLTKLSEDNDTLLVEVEREEGTIMQQGDPFSAANMNDLEARIAAGIGGGDENMAVIEAGPNSANPYAVNDLLIYNGQLYRVTRAIIVGNSLVSGVNITPTKLSTELKTTQTSLATTQTNVANLTTRVSTAESNITSANNRINTANTNITNVTNRVSTIEGELTANGSRIYMDYKSGRWGINTNANRGANTFHPFSNGEAYFYTFPNHSTSPFTSPCSGTMYCFCATKGVKVEWYQEAGHIGVQGQVLLNGTVVCNGDSSADSGESRWVDCANVAYASVSVKQGDTITVRTPNIDSGTLSAISIVIVYHQ